MTHVTHPERREQRHKIHPVTWVATAAIVPILCWDAWQTYKDTRSPKMSVAAQSDRAPRESGYAARMDEQLPYHVRP